MLFSDPRARNPPAMGTGEGWHHNGMIPVAGKSGTGTGPGPGVRPRVWQIGDSVGSDGDGGPGASPISADRGWDSRPRPRTNRGRGRGRGIGASALIQSAGFFAVVLVTQCLLPFRASPTAEYSGGHTFGLLAGCISSSVMLAPWLLAFSSSAAVTGPRGPLNSQPESHWQVIVLGPCRGREGCVWKGGGGGGGWEKGEKKGFSRGNPD